MLSLLNQTRSRLNLMKKESILLWWMRRCLSLDGFIPTISWAFTFLKLMQLIEVCVCAYSTDRIILDIDRGTKYGNTQIQDGAGNSKKSENGYQEFLCPLCLLTFYKVFQLIE